MIEAGEAHVYAAGDRLDVGVEQGLRPLLDLPVEHVLAPHGGPFHRAALGHALTTAPDDEEER
jgi:hypothetical protein